MTDSLTAPRTVRPTTAKPDLTTVVVSWNTVGLLDECLASIVEATPAGVDNQIVLVDNASADGSADHVRAIWPDVLLVQNEENLGFCRANNIAIRMSSAPVVLLVNTDARLAPGSVGALLRSFDDPQVAAVGPRLVYADGTFQRWTAGQLPTLASMAVFLLGLDRLRPWHGRGLYLGADLDRATPGWVSSAVLALRRSSLEEVGLLDEDIFVYMDDVDLCARLTGRGWRIHYAAEITATHFMGASSTRNTGKVSPEAVRALNRWFVRRHGPAAGRALRLLEVVGFGARVLAHSVGSASRTPGARGRRQAQLCYLRLALEPSDG